jgi:hypothetical protein
LHEPGGGVSPRRPVTTWWLPGKDRYKYSAVRESHVFRVSQRCQAARRAADTGNDPDYARHGDRPRWTVGGTDGGRRDAPQRAGAAAASRGPLPVETAQPLIPGPPAGRHSFISSADQASRRACNPG